MLNVNHTTRITLPEAVLRSSKRWLRYEKAKCRFQPHQPTLLTDINRLSQKHAWPAMHQAFFYPMIACHHQARQRLRRIIELQEPKQAQRECRKKTQKTTVQEKIIFATMMPILAGLPKKWLKQNIAKLCLWVHRFLDVSAFLVLLGVLWAALASSCSERCSFLGFAIPMRHAILSIRYSEIMHFRHSEVSSKHKYA